MTTKSNDRARSMLLPGLAITALLGLAAVPAHAQGTKSQRDACEPDVFRLCSSEIPDVNRIVGCLNRQHAKLSPACRTVMNGGGAKDASRER